jgi:hypothetical protein
MNELAMSETEGLRVSGTLLQELPLGRKSFLNYDELSRQRQLALSRYANASTRVARQLAARKPSD